MEINDLVTKYKKGELSTLDLKRTLEEQITKKNPYPLSQSQLGLWAIHKAYPNAIAYHIPMCFESAETICFGTLKRTIKDLCQKHEGLRTKFLTKNGKPYQHRDSDGGIRIEKLDSRELSRSKIIEWLITKVHQPMSLEHDTLLRVFFSEDKDGRSYLLFVIHHIICDGISAQILISDFLDIYHDRIRGKILSYKKPPFYADFVKQEQQDLQSQLSNKKREFWRKKLAGEVPILDLPMEKRRYDCHPLEGVVKTFSLNENLVARCRKFAKKERVFLSIPLLVAYKIALRRFSGQSDLVIGIPSTLRPSSQYDKTLGHFVNMLPHRARIEGQRSFKDQVAVDFNALVEELEHQHPFNDILREIPSDHKEYHSPIFQAVFEFQNFMNGDEKLLSGDDDTLKLTPIRDFHQQGEYEFCLEVFPVGRHFHCHLKVHPGLYSDDFIRGFISHYQAALDALLSRPQAPIAGVEFMKDEEQQILLNKWNDTHKDFNVSRCIHEIFQKKARQVPDKIAVCLGDQSLTYAQLDRRSDQLARFIQSSSSRKTDYVAISLDPSLEMAIGLLGILKAGFGYVPIDPETPEERMIYLMKDTGASLVLTQEKWKDRFLSLKSRLKKENHPVLRIIKLDRRWWRAKNNHVGELPKARPADPAYVIYTSGSTGLPKGVKVSHQSVLNTLLHLEDQYPCEDDDRFLLKTSFTFDVSVTELFSWFIGSGCLEILSPEARKNPEALVTEICQKSITHINFSPTQLESLLHAQCSEKLSGCQLKFIMVAGEAFPMELAKKAAMLLSSSRVENIYGPTEASIYATSFSCSLDSLNGSSVPIGRPIANTRILILDEDGQLCPIGVTGQLCIAGGGLAEGYLNQKKRSHESFITNPYPSGSSDDRLYLTGDMARWNKDGLIEYLGRKDHQVKIRGYRIELGEIESALTQISEVVDAVVVFREHHRQKELIAYYTSASSVIGTPNDIRHHLSLLLPAYMIPSHFVPIESFPVLPSGKINRTELSLRSLESFSPESADIVDQTDLESEVKSLWIKVLEADNFHLDMGFYEAGGNSILAVYLAEQISAQFGLPFTVLDLFKHVTIRGIAQYLESKMEKASIEVQTQRGNQDGERNHDRIAIIGISCEFPGSVDHREFWDHLCSGKEAIQFYGEDELKSSGIPEQIWSHPNFVPLNMSIVGKHFFDAEFFRIRGKNAAYMDPQFRILLEHAYRVVEDAGYKPDDLPDTSVFVSTGNSFYQAPIYQEKRLEKGSDAYLAWMLAQSGTIPTMISYQLGFRGPSLATHSNCSSSLSGLHLAITSLRQGESKTALVGASTLLPDSHRGYLYQEGMNFSKDGHCRPFDSEASGMVMGEGVATLLLKREEDALRDGDHIYAVVRGSAMNNDGKEKSGFYTPSRQGQVEVIQRALDASGVSASEISYVEAHGTGTKIGDPVEFDAISEVFRKDSTQDQFCSLGSVKANIGHLDTASGLAGCIKVALSLSHGKIPPTINFKDPNPAIDLKCSPFYVETCLKDWHQEKSLRRAGLSSFGIGGTNVHVIMEEAPVMPEKVKEPCEVLVPVSARSMEALDRQVNGIKRFLESNDDTTLRNLAYTLQVGRVEMDHRIAFVVEEPPQLMDLLNRFLNRESHSQIIEKGQMDFRLHSDVLREEAKKTSVWELGYTWVAGHKVSWQSLYQDPSIPNPRRLSLPTYPFERTYFPPLDDHQKGDHDPSTLQHDHDRTPSMMSYEDVEQRLRAVIAKATGLTMQDIHPGSLFESLGLDSVLVSDINLQLESWLGSFDITLFYKIQSIAAMAHHIFSELQPKSNGSADLMRPSIESVPSISESKESCGDIAIIGIAGKFPMAENLGEYWQNLLKGRDCIEEIPRDRWPLRGFYEQSPKEALKKGLSYSKWGGFLRKVDTFDPLFFNISPVNAVYMDPQERLFLETAWHCLEDAGYSRSSLSQTERSNRIGVFAGATVNNYQLHMADAVAGSIYSANSQIFSIANRVSFELNFTGPSLAVDTACSSSLYAVHLACESLWSGQSTMALAGGVNLSVHPSKYVTLSQAQFCSEDGRCRSFCDGGTGYVPAEGVAAVLLKPLRNAQKDGDQIYAVIKGSGASHAGRTNGYTVPNPISQSLAIEQALKRSNMDPRTISCLEAHGTGTPIGDPIEMAGLKDAYHRYTKDKGFCGISSVKSNIGHAEAAAGVAQLAKVVLQLKNRKLVKNLNHGPLNPKIDFKNSPFFLVQENMDWDRPILNGKTISRRAGISSFGAGGANVHIVVEEAPEELDASKILMKDSSDQWKALILVSAADHQRLRQLAGSHRAFIQKMLDREGECLKVLSDIAYTLQVGRECLKIRMGFVASSLKEALGKWDQYLDDPERFCDTNQGFICETDTETQTLENIFGSHASDVGNWLANKPVDWSGLAFGSPKRMSLPLYPFAEESYWVENKHDSATRIDTWLCQPVWRKEVLRPTHVDRHIIFSCDTGDGVKIQEDLAAHGLEVIKVPLTSEDPGPSFKILVASLFECVKPLIQQTGKSRVFLQVVAPDHLYHIVHGVSSFLKTVHKEAPRFSGQLLFVDSSTSGQDLLKILLENRSTQEDIRYVGGEREVLGWQPFLRKAVHDTPRPPIPWKDGSCYLMTGGTGGVGCLLIQEIFSHCSDICLVVIGRSPLTPDKSSNFKEYETNGNRILYYQGDVSQPGVMDQCIAWIEREGQRINGVLHVAGVIRDRYLSQKNWDDFLTVMEPKVSGTIELDLATRDKSLDFFLVFSSGVAPFGSVGQADYAAANGFMDAFVSHRGDLVDRKERTGLTLSVNWPMWQDGGMEMDAATEEVMFKASGLVPMRTSEAMWALYHSLASGLRQVMVLVGDVGRLEDSFLREKEPHERVKKEAARFDKGSASLHDGLKKNLRDMVADVIQVEPSRLSFSEPFERYGIDSIAITNINYKLEEVFGDLSKTLLFDCQNLEELAERLWEEEPVTCQEWCGGTADSVIEVGSHQVSSNASQRGDTEDGRVAIIGLSGVYPGADSLLDFWQRLKAGDDFVSEIPAGRWGLDGFYTQNPEEAAAAGKSYGKWGSFIRDFAAFDPLFFGISPKEAKSIDPQERLFLQSCWHVVEDAGYTREIIRSKFNRNVGVFAGITKTGFDLYGPELKQRGDQTYLYTSFSSVANRVSYVMDFTGPSIPVDTMCSSSLTAIHLACESLTSGACSMAIAGGVNLYLHPSTYVGLSAGQMLSPTGRCHSFSQKGDGFVPGEGVGAVLLKPLRDALRDGDPIHGVIRGSAINHGGRTHGYTVPSPKSQAALVRQALSKAGVNARDISYLEAHGTGTELGDPIEIDGLDRAFSQDTSDKGFCHLGSLKSNLGHMEAAAGIGGLTKVLLQMKHRTLVPSLHAASLNENIRWSKVPFVLQRDLVPWNPGEGKRLIAGISSFGAGGANAHLVVEQSTREQDQSRLGLLQDVMVPISAKSQNALLRYAQDIKMFVEHDRPPLVDLSFTLQIGREPFGYRLGILAHSHADLCSKLDDFIAGAKNKSGIFTSDGKVSSDAAIPIEGFAEDFSRWVDHKQLEKILEAWTKGQVIDWTQLYSDLPSRISAPTYPFDKDVYWFEGVWTDDHAEGIKCIHPLLHRNVSSFEHQRFITTLHGSEPFLRDHIVGGRKTLPGVAYLEMARSAICESIDAANPAHLRLYHVVWAQPVVVDQAPLEVTIQLEKTESHKLRFEIKTDADQEILHCQGYCEILSQTEGTLKRDLGRIKDDFLGQTHASIRLEGEECYKAYADAGLEYGASHRGLNFVIGKSDSLLAEVSFAYGEEDTTSGYTLPPGLMDSVLQSAIGMALGGAKSEPHDDHLSLPFALDELTMTRSLKAPLWVWARGVEQGSVSKLDFEIMDQDGVVLAQMNGFTSRKVKKSLPAQAMTTSLQEPEVTTTLLGPSWEVDRGLSLSYSKSRLIQTESDDENPMFTFGLSEQERSSSWSVGQMSHYQHDASDIEIWIHDLKRSLINHKRARILWLAPRSEGPLNLSQIDEGQNRGLLHLFSLCKRLLDEGLHQKELDLRVITWNSLEVVSGEFLNPTHSGVHGFVGSLAKEHPKWNVALLDLHHPTLPSWGQLDVLFRDRSHETIAVRFGQCFRQHLVPVKESYEKSCGLVPKFRQNGVYMIIGGAGGLGEIFSRYLINEFDAQIVWIGRSAANEKINASIDSFLTQKKPLYLRVDASNLSSLESCRDKVLEKFGAIHGVIHSALVLADASLVNMSEAVFKEGFDTKARISLNIHQAFASHPLDCLIYFSSMVSFSKAAGQSNYAAGCVFQDAFASYCRNVLGLPSKVINWGYWGHVGVVASEDYRARMKSKGIESIDAKDGIHAFEFLMSTPWTQLGFVKTSIESIESFASKYGNYIHYPSSLSASFEIQDKYFDEQIKLLHDAVAILRHSMVRMEELLRAILRSTLGKLEVLDGSYSENVALPQEWLEQCRSFLREGGGVNTEKSIEALWDDWDECKKIWMKDPSVTSQVLLVETCLKNLAPILKGEKSATSVMFPDSSSSLVEGLYRNNVVADFYNQAAADLVLKHCQNLVSRGHRSIRIIEIGGGTGGLTSFVVPLFKTLDGAVVEYCFTDLSPSFLSAAQERFGAVEPCFKSKVLDISKPCAFQEVASGSYDLVLASNVIHATPCIKSTLRHVKTLLVQGGLFLMNEMYGHPLYSHLTFGLLDGWWLFEDGELREPGGPALSPESWNDSLLAEGFEGITFPVEGAHDCGQQIIVAQSDGVALVAKTPVARDMRDMSAKLERSPENKVVSKHRESSGIESHEDIDGLLTDMIGKYLAESLHLDQQMLDYDEAFADYGLDSISGVQLVNKLNQNLAIELETTALFSYNTIEKLSKYIRCEFGERIDSLPLSSNQAPEKMEMAFSEHQTMAPEYTREVISGGKVDSFAHEMKRDEIGRLGVEGVFPDTHDMDRHEISRLGVGGPIPDTYDMGRYETGRLGVEGAHPDTRDMDRHEISRLGIEGPLPDSHDMGRHESSCLGIEGPLPENRKKNQDIAIIGMSGQYAASSNLEEFWYHLREGHQLVGKADRWESAAEIYQHGSFLDDIDMFDPMFFKISGKEAVYMDPQQRIFLMQAWKALEDAGYVGESVRGKLCGVYVGCGGGDYSELFKEAPAQAFWGNSSAIVPARIAYYLNLQGPAVTVDTACSSSLVAIHQACQALWLEEIEMALAGGVFIQSTPRFSASALKASMLSPSGRCFTFDERADGFVPGEGAGAIVLKTLAAAQRDRDHVYGVIKGSGMNQDGHSNGITAPNALAQERLEKDVYRRFDINPESLQYVEAHGTGTKLGDPIEFGALSKSFRAFTSKRRFCAIGSVKTNIGHAATAAGIAGIHKILLSFKHGQIPASLGFKNANPSLRLEESPFYVNTQLMDWPEGMEERLAAISSFGFSGTNAHLVLSDGPKARNVVESPDFISESYLVVLSAPTEDQLKRMARDYLVYCKASPSSIANISYTTLMGRSVFSGRLAIIAKSVSELSLELTYFIRGDKGRSSYKGFLDQSKYIGPNDSWESCERGKVLGKAAEAFVRGLKIDKESLFFGHEGRTPLPTYPFIGESYWVEPSRLKDSRMDEADVSTLLYDGVFHTSDVAVGKSIAFDRSLLVTIGLTGILMDDQDPGIEVIDFPISGEDPSQDYLAVAQKIAELLKDLIRAGHSHTTMLQFVYDGTKYPLFSGIAALLRCAKVEYSKFSWQVIGILEPRDSSNLREILALERKSGESCEVRYERSGRKALCWSPSDDKGSAFCLDKESSYGFGELSSLRADGYYLITGGTGGIGLALASMISRLSPRINLVLIGRRSETELEESVKSSLDQIRLQGTRLMVQPLNLGYMDEVESGIRSLSNVLGHLRGIFHCAGVTCDSLLVNKTNEDFEKVFSSKVSGTYALDGATSAMPLDFFVLFSSVTSVFGHVGQVDYAAANGFLDSFAFYRQALLVEGKRSGKTISINWPLWEIGGMGMSDDLKQVMADQSGMHAMNVNHGMKALDFALSQSSPRTMVLSGDAARLKMMMHVEESPPLNDLQAVHGKETTETGPEIYEETVRFLQGIIANEVGFSSAKVRLRDHFETIGIDSVLVMQITNTLEKTFGPLSKTLFFEYQNLADLSRYFADNFKEQLIHTLGIQATGPRDDQLDLERSSQHRRDIPRDKPILDVHKVSARDRGKNGSKLAADASSLDVAIIGLAGRYPMANNLSEFWENLKTGRDCISEIPEERWNWRSYYDPEGKDLSKHHSRWGGFIDDASMFDPLFFKISPREASFMDPQERHFMQASWAAVEDAGYTRDHLEKGLGSSGNVGVYVGVMYSEYQLYGAEASALGKPTVAGGSYASISNRVSYFMNLHGPSMTVDTMCSSSLTSLHLACQDLRLGRTRMAIAGGVNLSIHPNKYSLLSGGQFISKKGRCESFGEGGEGYIPGEGVGAAVLKKLEDALEDGDHIYGVIKGTALNHGGKTTGYSVPNPTAQRHAISQALEQAGIGSEQIGYIEAHGTGTKLGDPIEVTGLTKAFHEMAHASTKREEICWLGSAKSNIGHCESAAGIAGVTKVLLQMKHRQIAPSLHSKILNPHIEFDQTPFRVNQDLRPWPKSHGLKRCAGVSSFGAGGANAHIIIQEYEEEAALHLASVSVPLSNLILLSAQSLAQLRDRAGDLLEYVVSIESPLDDSLLARIAYTLQVGRESMSCRLAIYIRSLYELSEVLDLYIQGKMDSRFVCHGDQEDEGSRQMLDLFDEDDEFDQLAYQWLIAGKPLKVLGLWVRGVEIDWQSLYDRFLQPGQLIRKISLPTYPFAKVHCWLELDHKRIEPSQANLYPLIHENISRLDQQRYRSRFVGDEPFLADHKVSGRPILPATAYLEMAVAATIDAMADGFQELSGGLKGHKVELVDVLWLSPIEISEERDVFLEMDPIEDDSYSSFEVKVDSVVENRDVACQGLMRLSVSEDMVSLEIDALKSRMLEPIDMTDLYERFHLAGLEYGLSHQGIRSGLRGENEVLVELERRGPMIQGECILDPGVLDSALQGLVYLQAGDTTSEALDLPFSLDHMTIFGSLERRMWCWLRPSEDIEIHPGGRRYDLDLMTMEGRVLCELRGFHTREMASNRDLVNQERDQLNMLVPVWNVIQPIRDIDPVEGSGRTLVFGGGAVESHDIRQVVSEVKHLPYPEWNDDESSYELLMALHDERKIDRIIWFVSEDMTLDPLTDTLIEVQQRGIYQLIYMVKALLRIGYDVRNLKWTIVTRSTYGLHQDEPIQSAHAGIHGYLGSLAKEYPHWEMTLVDIGFGERVPVGEIFRLPYSVRGDAYVYREGEWYQQSLTPLKMEENDQPAYRQRGVYVVIGGAGGIGEVWSRWMIEHYDARIVWIGRRSKDESIERKISNIVGTGEFSGDSLIYLQGDASERESLERVYTTIKQRFGSVHGVVHSAIVLNDRSVAKMTLDTFEATFKAKCHVSICAAQVFHREDLDFILFFSSLMSFDKAAGQSNYAAGCTFKDAFAKQMARHTDCKVKIMNWGYWGSVGVVRDESYQQRMRDMGIGSIEPDEGLKALENLMKSPFEQMVLLKTHKKDVRELLG